MNSVGPDMVRTASALASLLQLTRVVRLDNLSYDKMATRLNGEISKSELGRIFSGEDFPSRKQLQLLLGLFGIDNDDHESWNAMWERLATARFTTGIAPAAPPVLLLSPEAPPAPGVDPGYQDLVERSQRMALRVVDDAITEAERILHTARTSAEDERQSVITEAQDAARLILARTADEQAVLIRGAEQRIAAAFDTAESGLRKLVTELNDSVADTAGNVRRLVDEVRSSMAMIQDDLTSLRQDVSLTRRTGELSELSGTIVGEQVIAPAVIGHPAPDYGPPQPHWFDGDDPNRR